MDVILLERIEKLGQMGDVVKVKPGFARNFLLPQRKALRASKGNLELFESQRKQLEADNLERRQEAEKVGEKLNGLTVSVIRSAGDTGQLYGSVSARDITEAVTAAGFTIARGQVDMDRPVKALGLHEFRIRLHPEVAVTITVNVARSPEEAEVQAKLGRAVISGEEVEAANERPEEEAAPTPEELDVFDAESAAVPPTEAEDAKG